MAITRRQFLRRTGLATAGSFLAPPLFANLFARKALADAIGDRYLIVLFQDGGNDGLNTVTPISGSLRTIYEAVRGTGTGGIQLTSAELAATAVGTDPATGSQLGLHPALTGFKGLWDSNHLAVIQGCGYPDQNLSHATSRGYWESGDRFGVVAPSGWMGRFLIESGFGGSEIAAVNVRGEVAGEFVQTQTSVLTFDNLNTFDFPYDESLAGGGTGDTPFKEAAYQALHSAASGGSEARLKFIGDVGSATLAASKVYPDLNGFYGGIGGYPSSSVGRNLRDIAKVIYGVEHSYDPTVCARYFELRNGGYDTHSNQGGGSSGRQFSLHQEVGDAVAHFYDDLEFLGIADKVCMVIWSEFGRRVNQNSSGTDHGSQAPMFVIGGAVNGGIYGNHPDIGTLDSKGNTIYSQNDADSFRSTDFRDVFGTILRHWLNLADPEIIFPRDDWGDPNRYWEVPDFDLPFLP